MLRQLPDTEHNAVLHLLSATPAKVQYGASHYQQHSAETSTLLERLIKGYQREGVAMPYTMEDFRREYLEDGFEEMTLALVYRVTHDEGQESAINPGVCEDFRFGFCMY